MSIKDSIKKIFLSNVGEVNTVNFSELNDYATQRHNNSSNTDQENELVDIEITPQYEIAVELIKSNYPIIFVSGHAGTGKSTFIKYLRNTIEKQLVVVAPTGVAALNVQGQTIHSFFHFPPKSIDLENIKPVYNRKLYEKLELIIIDEISMVRADLMDGIDHFLRVNRFEHNKPFGGVQVLLIGDLFQLPPVVANNIESNFIYERYKSPYFFSSHCLRQASLIYIELEKVFRQESQDFINLLNNIREAKYLQFTIDELNRKCLGNTIDEDKKITLTCNNNRANQINRKFLDSLSGDAKKFEGLITGKFNIEKDKLPSPYNLFLKENAKVMFTKNDTKKRWVNGTIGKVVKITNGSIFVETTNNGRPITHSVSKVTWDNFTFKYDREKNKIVSDIIGSYTQFPLILSWAITIHKSQGKTLDNIEVDLSDGTFANGQLYVALSRCPNIEGIKLKKPIAVNNIKCDSTVSRFYELLRQTKNNY